MKKYSRLQKVGIWAWDDFAWCSFFSRLLGWRAVIFQLSGFYGRVSLHTSMERTTRGLHVMLLAA